MVEAASAIGTLVLAGATALMVWEIRKTRLEGVRRDREVAFRAALVEISADVQHLEGWNPQLQDAPSQRWMGTPLAFTAVKELLARVWVLGVLWDRIMSLITNLEAYDEMIKGMLRDLPARREDPGFAEQIKDLYHCVDLYLKQ